MHLQGDDGSLRLLVQQVLHAKRDLQDVGRQQGSEHVPIVKLANRILEIGLAEQASDIHLEPLQGGFRIRFRLDGTLMQWPEIFPLPVYVVLVARLKIMAGMDTSERRKPADGHISYVFRGRKVDLRVASVPVKYGETMVLRLMSSEDQLRSIDELGFSEENEKKFRELIHRPSGMLIVSGPMNSGKSSSLYAALQALNSESRSIMTIEDPVECVLEGINQMEVNEKAGLSFATGLRAALRCDCNCLMVGEIRDPETAQIALRAALTGHMLFTTVHAGDSIATLFRLLEMGVPPYLLAATLSGVVAQRLVRRICLHCRVPCGEEIFPVEEGRMQGEDAGSSYRGKGCGHCHQTGYAGRVALHEILEMNESLRQALLERCDMDTVRRLAVDGGWHTLYQDGMQKIRQGITTWEEVRKVLYEDG